MHISRRVYLIGGWLCWLLLLSSVLYQARPAEGAVSDPGLFLDKLLSIGFILCIFQYYRLDPAVTRSNDFIATLGRLLLRAGGLLLVCLLLYFGYRATARFFSPAYQRLLLNGQYQLLFGGLVFFFARTFVVWKRLILHHLNKIIVIAWHWFEILLLALLLLGLLNLRVSYVLYPLLLLMLVYVFYLSLHLRWVAYLSIVRKWKGIFYLAGILLCTAFFINYFYETSGSQLLVLDHSHNLFLLVLTAFLATYCLLSLLVALFNLPTTNVFEQKRDDIVNFQRLSQTIQQGKNETEVFEIFFDSALKASQADAGWLDIIEEGVPRVVHQANMQPEEMAALRELLLRQGITDIDYLNNNLTAQDTGLDGGRFRSFVQLILRSQKAHYASLYLLKDYGQGFEKDTLSVLRTFISQTIVTVDNFRLLSESIQNEQYKKELAIAARIQDSLLPKSLPSNIPLDISIFNVSAKEVGGDFYDFFEIDQNRLAILIGDVSGKGISAAFYMAQMKGIFQALMQLELLPDEFMKHANAALSSSLERSSFITATVYYIDYTMKGIAFARAGHCHTLYHNCGTQETFYFETEGLALGVMRDKRFNQHMRRLHYDYNPGDVMVLYTDGITEARSASGEEYGTDRLQKLLEASYQLPAEEIKEVMINDLKDFSQGVTAFDDQTLLVLKFR